MPRERAGAFAPGRVNLIGEHTDYNGGLALPFAISQGVTVRAEASGEQMVRAHAVDLDEEDAFALADRARCEGWRAFVRGTVAELTAAGFPPVGARLQIGGDLPPGAGLSSSAALEVALCLALLALAEPRASDDTDAPQPLSRLEIARLCARVENDWVGAQTGLLDQLASLFGQVDTALRIDFPDARRSSPCRCGWRAGGWSCSTPASATRTRAPATTSAAPSARGPASCSAWSRCARRAPMPSSGCPSRCGPRAPRARRERPRERGGRRAGR